MLSLEAQEVILGIKNPVLVNAKEMARALNLTFYPNSSKVSENIHTFLISFKKTLEALGVNIIPYEQALEIIPLKKRFKMVARILGNDIICFVEFVLHKKSRHIFMDLAVVLNALKGAYPL